VLRANIDWKSAFLKAMGQFWPNFYVPTIFARMNRPMNALWLRLCLFDPPPVKFRAGVGEMSESRFQVPCTSQRLIYFWRGTTARAGRFNPFSRLVWGRTVFPGLVFRVGGTELHEIWGGRTPMIDAIYTCLAFRHVAPLWNQSHWKWKLSRFFRGRGNFVRSSSRS